jgi:hypothetical protein
MVGAEEFPEGTESAKSEFSYDRVSYNPGTDLDGLPPTMDGEKIVGFWKRLSAAVWAAV